MLQRRNRHNRLSPQINAGSMADIAFLLLIFFLVTSQIGSDRGLLVKLPPINPSAADDNLVEPRNVLKVDLLSDGTLTVRDKIVKVGELTSQIQNFVLNPTRSIDNSQSPTEAVISFSHDENTPYEFYINVYNELQGSFNLMRNDLALQKYGKKFSQLSDLEKEAIRTYLPVNISEVPKPK